MDKEIEKEYMVRVWHLFDSENTLRLKYNLNQNSIVFDIGGYHGDWSEKIIALYNPYVYIFEPVKEYFLVLKNKFVENEKIKVFNYGLSSVSEKKTISLLNDGSSIYVPDSENKEIVNLISISEFIKEHHINNISLMKLNVEGGEYEILKELIVSKLVKIIDNFQIQFHDFVENAIEQRNLIRDILVFTHKCIYNFDFIWEGWSKEGKSFYNEEHFKILANNYMEISRKHDGQAKEYAVLATELYELKARYGLL
jgi:FkbM family methyltransferase